MRWSCRLSGGARKVVSWDDIVGRAEEKRRKGERQAVAKRARRV
jgi:hypothetical protein